MAGIYVGGAPPHPPHADDPGAELNGVLRAALLSAQHLLRERFEKRVAWVDGHWEWAGVGAVGAVGAPPLPAEARKKVADVSRLFEILTNAQFRDREPLTKPSSAMSGREIYPMTMQSHTSVRAPAPAASGDDSAFLIVPLVLLALVAIWIGAVLIFHRNASGRHVKHLKQRINGWFTKKAAAADGDAEAEQTLPRDDPPPPYFDSSAEPFLQPGGIPGTTLTGSGDLPPPYSSCDAQPDCKAATSSSLMDGVGAAGAMSEIGAGTGSTVSDVCGAKPGKTDDEGCSKSDSTKAAFCDSSLVVVV